MGSTEQEVWCKVTTKEKKALFYGEFRDFFPYEISFDAAIARLNAIKKDISKDNPEFVDDIRLVVNTHISQGDYDYGAEIFDGIDIIAYRDETDEEHSNRMFVEELKHAKDKQDLETYRKEKRAKKLQQYNDLKEELSKEGLI